MRSTESSEKGGYPPENDPPSLKDAEGSATWESASPIAASPISGARTPEVDWIPPDVIVRRLISRRRLIATPVLIAINVAVHLNAIWVAPGGLESIVMRFGHARFAVWAGEYWRLFTALFVHGNVPHLVLNMIVLLMLGRVIERVLGGWKYLLTYLLTGLGGSLLFQVVSSGTGVGASGAVYGLVGVLLWMRYGRTATGRFAVTRRFVFWSILLVTLDQAFAWMIELSPGQPFRIATSAHLGGLVSGLFLGYFGLTGLESERHSVSARYGALVACGAVFGALTLYGCFFPVKDPIWRVWRGLDASENGDFAIARELYDEARKMAGDQAGELTAMIIELEMRAGRHDEAVRLWRDSRDVPLEMRVLLGYKLYEQLTVSGEQARSEQILDGLIAATELELRETPTPDLLNEVAWFLALRGVRLFDAREKADLAVKAMDSTEDSGFSWFQLGRDSQLAAYVNTLGWVEFLLGEDESALQNLTRATKLSPKDSPHFVYLAVAHWRLGNRQEARTIALKARKLGVRPASIEALRLAEVLSELGEE